MRHTKMLAVFAAIAAMLAAFAAVAAATTVTSPQGTPYTGTIKAQTEGHSVLHNAFTTVECNASVEGKVEQHGPNVTGSGKVATLSITNCTGSSTVTSPVAKPGSLEIHQIKGTNNGIVTSTGAEVVVTNHTFGGTCIYTTNSTQLGTLTGTPATGGAATTDIAATIPRTGGTLGAFCGATGNLTGSVVVTSPTTLYADE